MRAICVVAMFACTSFAAKPNYLTDGHVFPRVNGDHQTHGLKGGPIPISLSSLSMSSLNSSALLERAFVRLKPAAFAYGPGPNAPPYTLSVVLTSNASTPVTPDPDEGYTLNVSVDGASLSAKTEQGALRGLNTFVQLVQYNLTKGSESYVISPQFITDAPRLAYRGVMLDTGRRFISMGQLRTVCDAMEAWRFNVLNLHLTDSQSWPLEVDGLPDLSGQLSYKHELQRHVFSVADCQQLTQYCKDRGIRVVPEIDAPGHFPAAAAYPELGVCVRYNGSTCTKRGLFDISSDKAWDTLEKIWTSVIKSFPSDEYNIGGDEVDLSLWNSSTIRAWNQKYASGCPDDANLTCGSVHDVHPYFTRRLISIIRKISPEAHIMGWAPGIEGFYGTGTLAKSRFPFVSYINWNGYSPSGLKSWQSSMASMTDKEEASVILAGPFYVVDPKYPDCVRDPHRMLYNWEQMAHVDPLNFSAPATAKQRVRGALLTLWGDITGADSFSATPKALPYMAGIIPTLWTAAPKWADPDNAAHLSCAGNDDQACADVAAARCKRLASWGATAGGFDDPKHITAGCDVPYDPGQHFDFD